MPFKFSGHLLSKETFKKYVIDVIVKTLQFLLGCKVACVYFIKIYKKKSKNLYFTSLNISFLVHQSFPHCYFHKLRQQLVYIEKKTFEKRIKTQCNWNNTEIYDIINHFNLKKISCLKEICLFYLQRSMFYAAINKSVWCRFMYKVDGKSTSSSAWSPITSPLKLWFSTIMCVK